MNKLDLQQATELFSYDPQTGEVRWLARPVGHFPSQAVCNRWNARCAGKIAGRVSKFGYRMITVKKRQYGAHRLAWLFATGEWPTDQIDHINGRRDDNRRSNLRSASQTENQRNRAISRNNTSGIHGVHFEMRRSRWVATIGGGTGRPIYLGSFPSLEMAADARRSAEARLGYHPNHGRKAA